MVIPYSSKPTSLPACKFLPLSMKPIFLLVFQSLLTFTFFTCPVLSSAGRPVVGAACLQQQQICVIALFMRVKNQTACWRQKTTPCGMRRPSERTIRTTTSLPSPLFPPSSPRNRHEQMPVSKSTRIPTLPSHSASCLSARFYNA